MSVYGRTDHGAMAIAANLQVPTREADLGGVKGCQKVLIVEGGVRPGSHNTNPAASLRAGPFDLAEPGCRTGERRHG